MNKILILAAIEDELDQSLVEEQSNINILYTGIGSHNITKFLYQNYNSIINDYNLILNVGTCGSFYLKQGTLCLCDNFISFQEEIDGNKLYLEYLDNTIHKYSCLTVPLFIDKYNNFLIENKKFDVIDMEAYYITKFCKEHNIKLMTIKVVSDNLNSTFEEWKQYLPNARQILKDKTKEIILKNL